jgi:release factor glutamine methyltransferase
MFPPSSAAIEALDICAALLPLFPESPTVIDVATGPGTIALALADTHNDAEVHAIELHSATARRARRNARAAGLTNLTVYQGSLLEPITDSVGQAHLIVANLPFIPPHLVTRPDGRARHTVTGKGPDGLGLHRELAEQARQILVPGGILIFGVFTWQWQALWPDLLSMGYDPQNARRDSLLVDVGATNEWARWPG